MKKDRVQDLFLEQLRKVPNIQVGCEKVGVARSTVYKWREEDETFRTAMEEALTECEAMLNDLAENQLYSLMLERHSPSITFWLRHRNPKFKDKLEITGRSAEEHAEMTAQQDAIVQQGLAMLEVPEDESGATESSDITNIDTQSYDQHSQSPDSVGTNHEGQEAAPGGSKA